jgi:hypothetical protein
LYGWAKDRDAVRWFQAFASKQNPPLSKILSTWSDEWAVFAHKQYLAEWQPAPAAQPETHHEAYVRRASERREAERRESEAFSRNGR